MQQCRHNRIHCQIGRMHRPITGFSLMELLIVLGLLIVISGFAAPNLIDRLRDSTVYRGAETVREVLAEARTYAIDSGIDYQFRFEPDGQFFVVLPTEIEPGTTNSLINESASAEYMRLSGQLEDSLFLRSMADQPEATEQLEAVWFGGLNDSGTLATKTWSAPIYFRFDGSATDKIFRVTDEQGRTAELSVRGLTGAVRLSPVYRAEQK